MESKSASEVSFQTDKRHTRDPPTADVDDSGIAMDCDDLFAQQDGPNGSPSRKSRKTSLVTVQRREFEEKVDLYSPQYCLNDDNQFEMIRNLPPLDSPYACGVMIVDDLRMKRSIDVVNYLRTHNDDEIFQDVELFQKVHRLPKGGFRIQINPEDSLKWERAIRRIPNDGQIVKVHPPKSSLDGQERSVIVFGVDTSMSMEEFTQELLPVPVSAERFYKNGDALTTCRVTFSSRQVIEEVLRRKYVLFGSHLRLNVAKPRKKPKSLYCRTCKKYKQECSKLNCSNLRCGYCGNPHRSRECDEESKQEKSCIECNSTDHWVFQCPKFQERNKERKEKKRARNRKKRQRNKQQSQNTPLNDADSNHGSSSYADVVRGKSNQCDHSVNSLMTLDLDLRRIIVESYIEVVFPNETPDRIEATVDMVISKLDQRYGSIEEDIQLREVKDVEEDDALMSIDDAQTQTQTHTDEEVKSVDIRDARIIEPDTRYSTPPMKWSSRNKAWNFSEKLKYRCFKCSLNVVGRGMKRHFKSNHSECTIDELVERYYKPSSQQNVLTMLRHD